MTTFICILCDVKNICSIGSLEESELTHTLKQSYNDYKIAHTFYIVHVYLLFTCVFAYFSSARALFFQTYTHMQTRGNERTFYFA